MKAGDSWDALVVKEEVMEEAEQHVSEALEDILFTQSLQREHYMHRLFPSFPPPSFPLIWQSNNSKVSFKTYSFIQKLRNVCYEEYKK